MISLIFSVCIPTFVFSSTSYGSPPDPEYKVGERLLSPATSQTSPYKKTNWVDLIPADWDPMQAIKGLNLSKMKDSDPRVMDAMDKVRAAWDDSPVKYELNGERIEIPGFVVPLDVNWDSVRQFLLVPYFGACIHVPPPPSNQVIHVVIPEKLSQQQKDQILHTLQNYSAIVVSGTLEARHKNTTMGFSGYQLKAEIIAPYVVPKNKSKRNK